MKPIHTTLLMGIFAAISCVVAAAFYPWPEAETTSETSENLFKEFDNQVWSIKLMRYDRETEAVKSFSLRRKGRKWIIPSKSGFVATGQNISLTASCLNEKTILAEQSEDQQDHEKFGVLDPIDFMKATNRDSTGIKITLEDVNRTPLGSLIIGDTVRGAPNQRYVRKPGQPKVYIVEFDTTILTTEFGAWLDPNLLNLQTNQNPDGVLLDQVDIQSYRIPADKIESGEREFTYRIQVRPFEKEPTKMLQAEVPAPDGQWVKVPELEAVQRQPFGRAIQAIQYTPLVDVRPKEKALSKTMSTQLDKLTVKAFESATKLGFRYNADDGQGGFEGANGKLDVFTTDGVKTTLVLGSLATTSESATDALNYYMMIVAVVQDDMKTKPTAPEPAEGTELSEQEAKLYAREVEAWEKKSKSARLLTSEINRIHGGWYYIISEDVLEALRPAVSGLVPKQPAETEDENTEADDKDAKIED